MKKQSIAIALLVVFPAWSMEFFPSLASSAKEAQRKLFHKINREQKCSAQDITEYLHAGADINAQHTLTGGMFGKQGYYTPLQYACYRDLIHNSPEDTIELFINAGADVNMQNLDGDTALHFACENGNVKNVEILLKHKVNPNVRNNNEQTPLQWCAFDDDTIILGYTVQKKAVEIPKLLLANGARVTSKGRSGGTPLHEAANASSFYCSHYHDLMQLLINNGAKVNAQDNCNNTPLHYILHERKRLIDAKQNTQFHDKIMPLMIQTLIEHGADPFVENNQGKSFFTLAKKYDIEWLAYYKQRSTAQNMFAVFKQKALNGELIWSTTDKNNVTSIKKPPIIPLRIICNIFYFMEYPWTWKEQETESLLDKYAKFMQGIEEQ
jgi:ankyrin repeat protein